MSGEAKDQASEGVFLSHATVRGVPWMVVKYPPKRTLPSDWMATALTAWLGLGKNDPSMAPLLSMRAA